MTGFEKDIEELEDSIAYTRLKTIVGGDFNAKSQEWEAGKCDKRGSLLTGDLIVLNNGSSATFEREHSTSIINLTLVPKK